MGTDGEGLVHAAMFYRNEDEYLDAVVPFVREGLRLGDRVLVAVPPAKLVLLRDALGDDAARVEMNDMSQLGANPARTFTTTRALCDEHDGARVRMVGEPVWPERHPDAYPACVQNEALWNTAFATDRITTLCPYDAERLPEHVIADARCTHPLVWQDGATVPSADYADLEAIARFNQPLPADPDAARFTLHKLEDLYAARAFTARYAGQAGLSPDRTMDLQLIVSELATNSLKYSPGECVLEFWRDDGTLICQVSDSGRLDDPLAGRRLPDVMATSGRGLFLVNAVADLVRTHTSETGTTIRVYLDLDEAGTASR